jgi:hypothetical protein
VKHVAFFGDGERTFALPYHLIEELQRKTGIGFGALFQRLRTSRLPTFPKRSGWR